MGFKISFSNNPKYRVFNYQPRYYDERKERMEQRYAEKARKEGKSISEVGGNGEDSTYVPGAAIRNGMRNYSSSRREAGNSSVKTIIVLLSLATAVVLVYMLVKYFSLVV